MYTILSQDRSSNKRKIDDEFDTAKNYNHVRRKKKSNILMMRHPLGIKPWGNYYFDSKDQFKGDRRGSSLGNIAILTDDLILEILGVLDAKDLLSLGLTSRVFYCFSTFDDLWKQLTIQNYKGDWCWQGSWRKTFLKRSCSEYNLDIFLKPAIHLTDFYSDTLFQPFLCSSTGMNSYLGVENIDRRSNLELNEFIRKYAIPNKPVIITDVVTKWPAFEKWNMEYLVEKYGDVTFRAEAIDIKLRNYAKYCKNTMDESPLYLFDKEFSDKCDGIIDDFSLPEYFEEDFFNIFGVNRPDYRWLIIGPARSGSTFHKDPNSTSAWNAVITGSKKWILYPPDVLPPGVFTSADEAEVTSPVSIMEWHLNFYNETQKSKLRPLEVICKAGEIIFVPNGWWHMVINLEDSIAITQNFVGTWNLRNVLSFLRDKPYQISGFSNLVWPNYEDIHNDFYEKFKKLYPRILNKLESDDYEKKDDKRSSSLWDQLKKSDNKEENEKKGFTFGFLDEE
ncbi:6410_t:CDS:2 [Funneliformis geosporum]|uniref:2337_t:CDS:1 n=1 Tax=Funneliformis geosporum TaxID=1117311 RepID=A0A9W4X1M7_9GLOM|nr:2337_t:CDS:2 [Funneliformis geosporum]CAI2188881.1 6410_t:CDS:2 [Funneliformis geosporum]